MGERDGPLIDRWTEAAVTQGSMRRRKEENPASEETRPEKPRTDLKKKETRKRGWKGWKGDEKG